MLKIIGAPQTRPAPATPSRGAAAAEYADLYIPSGENGSHRCIRQVGGHGPAISIGRHGRYRLTNAGGTWGLNRMDANGTVKRILTLPPEENAEKITGHERLGTLYLCTSRTLYSIDAASGQVRAQRPLAFHHWQGPPATHLRDDGGLLIGDGNTLLSLSPSLEVTRSQPLGFAPQCLQPLLGGAIAAIRGKHLAFFDANGQERGRLDDVYPQSVKVDDRGSLWCIRERGVQRRIFRWDAAANQIQVADTAARASGVVPIRGDQFLVLNDEMERPQLLLYRSLNDAEPRRFEFHQSGHLRHFLLDSSRTHAYAMLEHHPQSGAAAAQRTLNLYRLPLQEGAHKKWWQLWGQPRLRPIWQRAGTGQPLLPAVASDGRLLIFRREGVSVLGPDGVPQQMVTDADQLQRFLGGARLITRRIPLGFGPIGMEAVAPSIEAHMRALRPSPSNRPVEIELAQAPLSDWRPPEGTAVAASSSKFLLERGELLFAPLGTTFTHSTQLGGMLAAATDDGRVYCLPKADDTCAKVHFFQVGSRLRSLNVDDRGGIAAVGENGNRLVIPCHAMEDARNGA